MKFNLSKKGKGRDREGEGRRKKNQSHTAEHAESRAGVTAKRATGCWGASGGGLRKKKMKDQVVARKKLAYTSSILGKGEKGGGRPGEGRWGEKGTHGGLSRSFL